MSPTDAALRAAVAAAPDAALPRLVYADFLDDHDQPTLAAAVRLDVALAGERPWADRYWQLRAEQPAGFPADLGRLADRQPLLCGVPNDWRSRWRAVRAFVSRWWNVPLGDVGRWGTEVEEAERIAGRELPPGVREWAALCTELPDDDGVFRDSFGMRRVSEHLATSLLVQAEQDLLWVVRDADLNYSDPPVDQLFLDHESDGRAFIPGDRFADTTSAFVVRYLTGYLPVSDVLNRYGLDRPSAVTRLSAELTTDRLDCFDVFEQFGVYAAMIPQDDGRVDLHACVQRTLPKLVIPEALWYFAGPVQEPLHPYIAALGDSANMFIRPRASRPH